MTTCQNLATMLGGTIILLPRFQLDEVLKAIVAHRVTVFPASRRCTWRWRTIPALATAI